MNIFFSMIKAKRILLFSMGLSAILQTLPISVFPQIKEKENQTEMSVEEVEARKIVDVFHKNFEQNLDINKVPSELFAFSFKKEFSKATSWVSMNSVKKVSEQTLYKLNSSLFNFLYLGAMVEFKNLSSWGKYDHSDLNLEIIFPQKIGKQIKKTRFLNSIVSDNPAPEDKLSSEKDVSKLTSELQSISVLFQHYLKSSKKILPRSRYKTITEIRKEDFWFEPRKCEDKCKTLPKETDIFIVSSFPLVFTLVSENKKLLILDIEMQTD